MNINKTLNAIVSDLMESQHSISDNTGYGYHGTVDPKIHNSKSKKSPLQGDDERARAHHYKKMHGLVRSLTGEHPKVVKHYLDSGHGRHLADVHNDNTKKNLAVSHVHNYIKKDFARFKKHYKADMFESIVDNGEIEFEVMEDSIEERAMHGEGTAQQHKVSVTYIHGIDKMPREKHVVVRAKTKDAANMKAAQHVSAMSGHEVIRVAHHSIVEQEQIDEISNDLRKRYIDAARKDSDERHEEGHKAKARGHYVYSAAQHEKALLRSRSAFKQEGKLKEEEQLDERFNHREAATKGVIHPDHTMYAKVGQHADFYSSKNGDKLYGKCTKNDGKEVHFQHEGTTHKFKVKRSYEGLHEEEQLDEWPTDQAKPKVGDKVIIKAPGSPHNNRRGTYGGVERGRHVVKHADGSRSVHGDGAVLKEAEQIDELSKATLRDYTIKAANDIGRHNTERTLANTRGDHKAADKHADKDVKRRIGVVKAAWKLAKESVNEDTKSADKKPVTMRGPNGKLITKLIPRKQDVVDSGGKKDDDQD